MARSRLAAACCLVVLFPCLAASQGLGEAARKEKEKRSGRKPVSRVYGDDDLRSGVPDRPSGEAVDSSPSGPPADAEASGQDVDRPAPGPDEDAAARARNEAAWRARARPVRQALEAAEAKVQRLQAELDRLERERLVGLMVQDYYAGRAADEARGALEQARNDLSAAQKVWDDFQDEARRAGALPGWLRDR